MFGLFVLYVVFSLSCFHYIHGLVQYVRWRICQSFLLLWSWLYVSFCIRQVYGLVFHLVRHIYGRLRRCICPCNCFFITSSILVRALKMVDASILLSLFMYVFSGARFPSCVV